MPQPIGKIEVEVYKEFVEVQGNITGLSQNLAALELRKVQILRELEKLNESATSIMTREAERIGIPQGTDWHITKDGDVFLGKSQEPAQE